MFETKLRAAEISRAIENAVERYMGRPIATTLRTRKQMQAVVDTNPFAEVGTNPAYSCVTFLSHTPSKSGTAPLLARDWKPELFQVTGKEICTWHPNGQGRSALAAALGKLPCVARSRRATGTSPEALGDACVTTEDRPPGRPALIPGPAWFYKLLLI